MFTTFDDVRDFAIRFVDTLVENTTIESDIDSERELEFEIQDTLIEQLLDAIKQEDCLIPDGGEAYEVTDVNEDYGVAFISSCGIPLGVFVIYTDEIEDEEDRLFVSINHSVVYLDGLNEE